MSTGQTRDQAPVHCWRLRVIGRVQGVGYRDFAARMARSLAICGWVRNEPDGSVTCILQHADRRKLELMVESLRQGPSLAQVERVMMEEAPDEAMCDRFTIRR